MKPGDALPPYRVTSVNPEAMRVWAKALHDPNPIHLDVEAVRAARLGGRRINQGPSNLAYMINMLRTAFPDQQIVHLDVRYMGNVLEGDALTAGGNVTAIDGGDVKCDIWLDTDERGRVIAGKAEIGGLMAWTQDNIPDLTGKVAVVTGGTDGLGREVARCLADKGAQVIVAGRNAERGETIARAIGGSFERLDVADLTQVRDFAGRLTSRYPRLDILVNNAGVALIPDLTRTRDGFEMQVGTNFLGPFALTAALLPTLISDGGGRVVNVSSLAAMHVKMDFDRFLSQRTYSAGKAYGWSKLAMLLFSQELDARSRSDGWPLIAVAAHPGVAASNLQNAGPSLNRTKRTVVTRIGNFVTDLIGQSTAAGALPLLRAATDPDTRGGSYYGPDGWGGIKGLPVVVAPPKSAREPALGARLWAIAEQQTTAVWPPASKEN